MKGLSYIWRMAMRRKTACLLVLLFTMAATVFLLIYPGFIEDTRARLDEAYENIPVQGWILNGESYREPEIPGELWKTLVNSGYFKEISAYGSFPFRIYPKERLMAEAGAGADEAKILRTMQSMLQQEKDGRTGFGGTMCAYNRFEACEQLLRIRENITWLDGYDESCLEGEERICILSDEYGYEPGDAVPILAAPVVEGDEMFGIFRIKVVATYHGKITGVNGIMPVTTYEELCSVATTTHQSMGDNRKWNFNLSSFLFTIEDNHKLDEIKDYLVEQNLAGSGGLRAAIDDRILKGTVAPIESNLALLEGLYRFFFVMITAIGFFISFLLARGRKAEYAVMRLLGESRIQITMKALTEQFVLCLVGVAIGALIERNSFDGAICAVILLCYTMGAAAAVMLNVGVNVMDILRDKE